MGQCPPSPSTTSTVQDTKNSTGVRQDIQGVGFKYPLPAQKLEEQGKQTLLRKELREETSNSLLRGVVIGARKKAGPKASHQQANFGEGTMLNWL